MTWLDEIEKELPKPIDTVYPHSRNHHHITKRLRMARVIRELAETLSLVGIEFAIDVYINELSPDAKELLE